MLLLTAATSTDGRTRFSEIDVERINIMGPNGKPDMVIANRERLPQPIINGKLDENGKPDAGMHLSMDRFAGDQQISLGHDESGGTLESGLKVDDRGLPAEYSPLREAYDKAAPGPEKDALLKKWKEAGGQQTSRMFVGKTRGKSSAVVLAAADGKPRIMMLVTPEGKASLDFYDETGKVVQHFPQADAAAK